MEEQIAIIGIGVRLPSGEENSTNNSPNKLWNNLLKGFQGVRKTNERWSDNFSLLGEISNGYAGMLPLDELKSFDPIMFGISPSEAPTIDPQQRLLLKTTWECLEDAGIDYRTIRGTNASVFIGSSTTEYRESIVNRNEQYMNIFGTYAHGIANRISYCFDLRGESLTIDTACSSSGVAISLGRQSILTGRSELSICGGVNLVMDTTNIKAFSYLNMLSTNGVCSPFDINANGLIRGEGVGTVVLKRLSDAIRDGNKIYCIVKGTSYNVDGNGLLDKQNFYAPSSTAQSENIRMALKDGKVNPEDITYFECHGTGTPTGDPIETRGISMVFNNGKRSRDDPLLIGSIKGSTGHPEAAAGVISTIKCCLMFKNQSLVPCVNYNTPNPEIKFDEWNLKVVTKATPFSKLNKKDRRIFAINSFGVTGSNCCLVLEEYKNNNNNNNGTNKKETSKVNVIEESIKKYLIPFSANSVKSLEQYQQELFSKNFDNIEFKDFVKKQILFKSKSLYQRSVIIASDWDQFKNKTPNSLVKTSNSKSSNISLDTKKPIIVYIFAGQGSQYSTQMLSLYQSEPFFKRSVDLIDQCLFKYYGYSVLDKFRNSDSKSIHEPKIAQPAVCMMNIALYELYTKYWGINGDFIVGHSLGEIAASYCSGMVDLDTLCYIIYHRSIAQEKTHRNGRMLSINITAEQFNSRYSSKYPDIEIACYNSPSSIVVAGNEEKLNEISNDLKENGGEFSAILQSLSSFHTSNQAITKDYILNMTFESKTPIIPIWSTVSTKLFNSNDSKFDSQYIYDNIVNPVRFSQTISNLYSYIEVNNLGNDIVFIELAPHPTLSFYLKQMVPEKSNELDSINFNVSIFSTINKKKSDNDLEEIQKTISKLYCDNNVNINFINQFSDKQIYNENDIVLPIYQWDDQLYWKSNSLNTKHYMNGPPISILGNNNYSSPYTKSYETYIDIKRNLFQYLKGHQVKGKYYFPGTGYIDNLLKIYPNQDLTIKLMEFNAPLIFMEGVNQCLQTNVTQVSSNEFKLDFHYKDNKTNEWVKTCNSNFEFSNNYSNEKLNIEELIQSKCNLTTIPCEELYSLIKIKTGLQYSGSFKGIKKCHIGINCSLSEVSLELPKNLPDQLSFFNATILDSCTHGLLALVEDNCQLVFHKIEDFKYYSSNIPNSRSKHSNIYVYTILNSIIDDSYCASIKIMLEDGTVLVEIDNLVSKSLIPIHDSLKIEYPVNELFSLYLQPKDSQLPTPSTFNPLIQYLKENENDDLSMVDSMLSICQNFISNQFIENIEKRIPELNLNLINQLSMDQLIENYNFDSKLERLFKFVMETIKKYGKNKDIDESIIKNDGIHEILLKSTKVISKLLFPLDNEDLSIDSPSSLFSDGLLDKFYNTSNFYTTQLQVKTISQIIKESIKPLLNEKTVIRILEFGGGVCSLSIVVLNYINQLLLDNPKHQIDIEFTWSDISSSFIQDAKIKLSHIKNINLIYRTIDLEQELIEKQNLKPSYYDFVIMANVLHAVKNIGFSLNEINKILSPNGQLLLIEPYVSIINDSIFGSFSQWWAYEDTNIRTERCCMSPDTWLKVISNYNYQDINISENEGSCCFVIHTKKPSIIEQSLIQNSNDDNINGTKLNYDIIIYCDQSKVNSNYLNQNLQKNPLNNLNIISTIQQFNQLIDSSKINDNTLIYFTKGIDQLDINNFKPISFEYIQINQLLLKHNLKSRHLLITLNSTDNNYLAASIVGAKRYFEEHNQLVLNTLDFDEYSIYNLDLDSIIKELINEKKFTQKGFIIRQSKVYYERVKKETNLKNKYQSNSFEENNLLLAKLSSNLNYELDSKKELLNNNQVEVKVLSFNILNYNDNNGDEINNNFGQFSGIVTRLGSNVDNKIIKDDIVYGFGNNVTSSHIVIDESFVSKKPNNLNINESSSIPYKYIESLYSIYNIGKLKENEIILIHLDNLSYLNILQWKQHKSLIFITVNSNKMKHYIHEKYGDLVTGIYLNYNNNFIKEIKMKLKQLNNKNNGVDLIINTLSNEYRESNINCLNRNGRIIDLTKPYLNNEYSNISFRMKANISYQYIDLQSIDKSKIKKLFNQITSAIENGQLKSIPIQIYSNSSIAETLPHVNKELVKSIVFENDNDILTPLIQEHNNQLNYSILKSNYNISESHLGKNIIVTGQSGIVLEILKWIAKYSKNVENIIILSRSSMKWELELLINKTRLSTTDNKNINFHFRSMDISNYEQLENTINEILKENTTINNIDSIFHFAYQQVVGNYQDISLNQLDISHGAKTFGAINLHNLSINKNWNLLNFVNASSTVTLAGSPMQATYVCANSVLDSFSRYRNSKGLPSICSLYGSIKSGLVLRNSSIEVALEGQGYNIVSMNKLLGALDLQIQNPQLSTNLIVSGFNFNIFKNNPQISIQDKFEHQINEASSKSLTSNATNNNGEKGPTELIISKISELLSIEEIKLNIDLGLIDYGSDSLIIGQLKNWIEKQFGSNIISTQQLSNNSINSLILLIKKNLDKKK